MIHLLPLNEIPSAAEVIRQSFRTVADEFGLTPENSPTHPAFLTDEQLRTHVDHGLQLFGLYAGSVLAGVVGLKRLTAGDFAVEKLAVLPTYRHRRFGAKLMIFAWEQIKQQDGEKACIGIIDDNTVLKQWYQRQGFIATEIKRFPHLPFTVCLMEKIVRHPAVDDALEK
ncbi:MAG: GNAT family N-acetyltransferase [Armatimonadota bacterium]